MTDFEPFDPRLWVDPTDVLVKRAPAKRRVNKKAPFEALRGLCAALFAGGVALGATTVSQAYSADPVVHSEVPGTDDAASSTIPPGYWRALLGELRRAPLIAESDLEDSSADPLL